MLTSITLKDYTTFVSKTIFDFKATNYKILENTNVGSNRILKGALFVGENASGKTQVLKSIVLLLDLYRSTCLYHLFLDSIHHHMVYSHAASNHCNREA